MLLSIPANQSLACQVSTPLKNATKTKGFRSNAEHAEHAEVFRFSVHQTKRFLGVLGV
jgi:hypothetical protein